MLCTQSWIIGWAAMLVMLFSSIPVHADTEILNFHLPLSDPAPAVDKIPASLAIGPSSGVTELEVTNEHPDLWVLLDLDPFKKGSYTARLSWPGSSPTRFNLTLHTSQQPPLNHLILHISSSPLSPRFPRPFETYSLDTHFQTRFHLVVEPLLLGAVPATALPAIVAILLFVTGASLAVPWLIRAIEDVKRDFEAMDGGKTKSE